MLDWAAYDAGGEVLVLEGETVCGTGKTPLVVEGDHWCWREKSLMLEGWIWCEQGKPCRVEERKAHGG